MMKNEWERQRSAFNHGWLKNQLITCVLRCKRVADEVVEDDMARVDLFELVNKWESFHQLATQVLEEIEFRLSGPVSPATKDALIFGEMPCRYLLEVERLRWRQLSNAQARVCEAEDCLCIFDAEIRRTRTHLQSCTTFPDPELLSQLEACARSLGAQFSSLTLCRDTILATDDGYH